MSRGVELTVSRDALERTLKQQLFSGPDGRYYLKGNAHSACFISTEDPQLRFEQDRIVVRVKTRARLGVGGACLGVTVTLPAEVSLEPDAEGETIGSAMRSWTRCRTGKKSTLCWGRSCGARCRRA